MQNGHVSSLDISTQNLDALFRTRASEILSCVIFDSLHILDMCDCIDVVKSLTLASFGRYSKEIDWSMQFIDKIMRQICYATIFNKSKEYFSNIAPQMS